MKVFTLLFALATLLLASSDVHSQAHVRWVAAGHEGLLSGMEYAPNGQYFVTCALLDSNVIVWDGITGKYLFHFSIIGNPISLAISPDSRTIAVGTTDSVVFYDYVSRAQTFLSDSTTRCCEALTYTPSGDSIGWIASGTGQSLMVCRDLRTNTSHVVNAPLKSHNSLRDILLKYYDTKIALSEDLHYGIIASDPVSVVSLITGKTQMLPAYLSSPIGAVIFFHGSDSLLLSGTGSPEDTCAIVSVATDALSRYFTVPNTFSFQHAAYLRGDTVLGISPTSLFVVPLSRFDTSLRSPSLNYPFFEWPLRAVLSPNHHFVVETELLRFDWTPETDIYGTPGHIVRYPFGDTSQRQLINAIDHRVTAAKFNPLGKSIAVASNFITLLNTSGDVHLSLYNPSVGLAYNSSGTLIALDENDYGDNGKQYMALCTAESLDGVVSDINGLSPNDHHAMWSPIVFSPTEHSLALGSSLWHFDSADSYPYWTSNSRNCFSPDGKFLYGTQYFVCNILDGHSAKLLDSIPIESQYCSSLDISPDGTTLVAGSTDGFLEVLSTVTHQSIKRFQAHHGEVTGAHFSPNGKLIITSGLDSTIKFWKVADFQLISTVHGDGAYSGVEISPDAKDILGVQHNFVIDYDSLPGGLAVSEAPIASRELTLEQNAPNPFHDRSEIRYSVPHSTHISIRVFDELGRTVGDVFEGNVSAGMHQVSLDRQRLGLHHGTYYYQLSTPDDRETRMMQLW